MARSPKKTTDALPREAFRRTAHVGKIDEEARTVEFTACSDEPLWRTFWGWEFYEVLDFRGVDMSWVRSGNAPVLWSHEARNMPVGIVETARKKKDGERNVVVVKCRFPEEDEDSDKVFRKIIAGTIRNVSVGWTSYEVRFEEGEKGDPDYVYFEKWRLDEVSMCSVPADTTVGIGRDAFIDAIARFKPREANLPCLLYTSPSPRDS